MQTTDRATAETNRDAAEIERRFERALARRREVFEKESRFSEAAALIQRVVVGGHRAA